MLSWHNWMEQAKRSFRAATLLDEGGEYFMACFSYQQAAEVALKAGLEAVGRDHHGRYLPGLLADLVSGETAEAAARVAASARRPTRLYIPTRYPDAEGGVPAENYDRDDAEQARGDAESILRFVESRLDG